MARVRFFRMTFLRGRLRVPSPVRSPAREKKDHFSTPMHARRDPVSLNTPKTIAVMQTRGICVLAHNIVGYRARLAEARGSGPGVLQIISKLLTGHGTIDLFSFAYSRPIIHSVTRLTGDPIPPIYQIPRGCAQQWLSTRWSLHFFACSLTCHLQLPTAERTKTSSFRAVSTESQTPNSE